jgi:hypothetical protein
MWKEEIKRSTLNSRSWLRIGRNHNAQYATIKEVKTLHAPWAPPLWTNFSTLSGSNPCTKLHTVIFLVTLKANAAAYFLLSPRNDTEYKLIPDPDPQNRTVTIGQCDYTLADVRKAINYGGSVDIIKSIRDHFSDLDDECLAWDGSLILLLYEKLDRRDPDHLNHPTPDFANAFPLSLENFYLGVLYKVCMASFMELRQRNIFFPYFYFVSRVDDYLKRLSDPQRGAGSYEQEWAAFGERALK